MSLTPEQLDAIRKRNEDLGKLLDRIDGADFKLEPHNVWHCLTDVDALLAELDRVKADLHVTTYAQHADGWKALCVGCSSAAGDYVWPCTAGRCQLMPELLVDAAELGRVTGERDEAQRMLANANSRVTEMQQKLGEANAALADVVGERNRYSGQLKHRQQDYRRTLHDVMEAGRVAVVAIQAERDDVLGQLTMLMGEHGTALEGWEICRAHLAEVTAERDRADKRGWQRGWDEAVQRQTEFDNRLCQFIPERYEANYNPIEEWVTDAAQVVLAALHLHKFGVLGPFPGLSAAVEKIYPELAADALAALESTPAGAREDEFRQAIAETERAISVAFSPTTIGMPPMPDVPMPETPGQMYRVGNHGPRHVYRCGQGSEEEIGVMYDPVDAAMVVAALNGAIAKPDAGQFFLREQLAAVEPEGWTVLPEGHPAEPDMIEAAYGVIACAWNVGSPPVEPVPGWNAAATRFRDWYHAWLDRRRPGDSFLPSFPHGQTGDSTDHDEAAPDRTEELKGWRAQLIVLARRLSDAHRTLIEQTECCNAVVNLLDQWGTTHYDGECACYLTSDAELEAAASEPGREDSPLVAWVMSILKSTPDGPAFKLADLEGIEPGFTLDLPDLKQRAEKVAPGVSAQIHELLGCTWGRRVGLPGDQEPCQHKADQTFILHRDENELAVKLCEHHAKTLDRHLDEMREAAAVAVTEHGEGQPHA